MYEEKFYAVTIKETTISQIVTSGNSKKEAEEKIRTAYNRGMINASDPETNEVEFSVKECDQDKIMLFGNKIM